MTLADVQAAKAALEAEGVTPSYNAIVARIGGSKRDVMRFMQELNGADSAAVAVEEPPAPTPLSQARAARDQTHQAEHALGLEEMRLKRQRQGLEQDGLRWEASAARQTSDAFDLEARRRLREIRAPLDQVEAQRRAVHLERREAAAVALEAREAFDALHGQAARWLRRLRAAQRQVQAGETAQQRGDGREEVEQALGELGRLVGLAEAQRCADDATDQPDWLKG